MKFRVQGAATTAPGVPAQVQGLPWANNRFVYQFSESLSRNPAKTAAFISACDELLQSTSLRCVDRALVPDDRDYVLVVQQGGNYSFVGRQGGEQLLSISSWNNRFKIMHEIKHALGWQHEHQQSRRDDYVEVLFDNIPEAHRQHFYINSNANEGEYDFDSIMHFYPTDLAVTGKESLRARAGFEAFQVRMGQRSRLSDIDVEEIRAYYGEPGDAWCGINRKPEKAPADGCEWLCQQAEDPAMSQWSMQPMCASERY